MKIKDLYELIATLKQTKRQGWLARGVEADSIAEHTYGATVIGWVLAKEEKVNKDRVVQMLLLHDLVMAGMDDVTPTVGKFAGKYDQKKEMEKETLKIVLEHLPQGNREEYKKLFNEYNLKHTKEAKIANEANKLETLFQGDVFEEETGRSDIFEEHLQTYASVFSSKTGIENYNLLKSRHEERKGNGKKRRTG